ncbi:tRNA(Ile)-lysidine synthetase [Companilactobacillus ginsenosidimutans]|uniref:tRNA(Ile)-lysidine synthase n=2 Tax=Companilactobacillus ginsenosidimutans TaxID=1007676 RepID=A0A0H4QMR2_9LACO|nr:tRNA(Ile)-lysidine synthetase [Companilactobacillus ginsenosidimutans]
MVTNVRKILKQYHAHNVLIAVSGGVDSIVLTDIVSKIHPKNHMAVVNVDHDLRPESQSEVEFVKKFCEKSQLKFFTSKWDHHQSNLGMEAAARKFRYGYFKQVMDQYGFDTLLTAHHANDLSENILMKLIRSGNVYEVTSLKSHRDFGNGQLLRPLLGFSKNVIKQYANKHDLKHVQDETNFEDITMRNRLRNDIFPQLQEENGQLLRHFKLFDEQAGALIEIANQRFAEIASQMKLLSTNGEITGNLLPVRQLTSNQQTLFWGYVFKQNLVELSISNKQIQQIIDVVMGDKPNGTVNLEHSWNFTRIYDQFKISRIVGDSDFEIEIELGQKYSVNNKIFRLTISTEENATFSVDEIPKHIILRTRQTGDRLTISPSEHQKLSKRFINKKISKEERNKIPILLFDNQIIWVEKIYNLSDYLKKRRIFFKIDFDEV